MGNIIQAQGIINGKNTYFITRPKDVRFDDGTTLQDKKFQVNGVDEGELETLLNNRFHGITFDEENSLYMEGIEDELLDPELIAYIDKLFASLNDMYIDVPETTWTAINNENSVTYTIRITVEDLPENSYPILHIVPGSNTNVDWPVSTINNHILGVDIEEKTIVINADVQIPSGFTILLKGVNVSGGIILENYNKLVSKVNDIYNSVVSDDIEVNVPITGWVLNSTTNLYEIEIEVIGMSSKVNPLYYLKKSDNNQNEKEEYDKIQELITDENKIILHSNEIPAIPYAIILKSVLISQDGEYGSYTQLVKAIEELKSEVPVTITDIYSENMGSANDRVAVSSQALYSIYFILKQKIEKIETYESNKLTNCSGKISVQKKGGICRVYGNIILTKTPVESFRQATYGLPFPINEDIQQFIACYNGDPIYININTSGIMQFKYGTKDHIYYIDITYPYAE